ncbi:fatty acid oxidation complex subunit alpha FadB [Pseudomonas umsongensis]|uniref:fatty acid oxidation complex subunit alpha FadB n=1 Tax=Pseudomonas umsongensis TaxID=198618 RepID=UPI00200ADD75|nr:fatty acid oxidation complex subunit alpha FadB [Pseudomonas umsongensis]MCK8682719.1 fatty acid oxidation complex subunit alpha FadB [Pseudomonas umsongensis]
MYQGQTLHLTALGEQLVELCFDRQGQAVNKFDAATLSELQAALAVLTRMPDLRGVLVTSAKDSFVVGADIFEFTELFSRPESELAAHNRGQSQVFTALSRLPAPVVCAINGLALGGGFEVTLACDYRVLARDAQVGVPEINLGIFPGLGGMARLPRLVGAAVAADWVTSGKPQSADTALRVGAVDKVIDEAELADSALALLEALAAGDTDWRQRRQLRSGGFTLDSEMLTKAKSDACKRHPQVPAALAAVELLENTAEVDLEQALKAENRAFAAIAQTQAAHALVQLFINDQFLRKKAKGYAKAGRSTAHAAVLGAGIMGGGIAYTSAARGIDALMKDIAQPALDLGVNEAAKLLDKQVTGGRLPQEKADAILASIVPTMTYDGFDKVDVVVEAVVENMKVKQSVLAEVEQRVSSNTVLASNTSSLSIAEMADALARPENFVGMHFFNPVPVMPLVEVIRGPRTSDQAAATIASYASAMGKTPVVVKDCPGFLVNRILTGNVLGFLRLIHDGADFQAVDAALEAFGWPMGPAYLQDVIGMDTSEHVIRFISGGYGPRMVPDFAHAVEFMVANGRLGQKNGHGFYQYSKDPKGRPVKTVDPQVHELLKKIQPKGQQAFTAETLVDRVMLPTVIEAIRCLEDGVAESAIEIDMALILGVGFPRAVGGALKYADWLGPQALLERCERYAHLGPLYQPTQGMRERAASGARYYS